MAKPKKEFTPQDFSQKYQQLCEETGFRIVVTPIWVARDDGTFSTKLDYTIGRLPRIRKS